jgi:hypothetical protein
VASSLPDPQQRNRFMTQQASPFNDFANEVHKTNHIPTIVSDSNNVSGANPFLANILDKQNEARKSVVSAVAKKFKVTIEFKQETGKFVLSEEDKNILPAYLVEYDRLKQTLERIENDVSLRPFEYKQPFIRRLGY